MGLIELIGIAFGLSMDACAVAMTNGATDNKMPFWRVLLIGLFFGFFQFLMPMIGFYVTDLVAGDFLNDFEVISACISFGILAFLGGKMLFESIREMVKANKEKNQTTGAGTDSPKNIEKEKCEKLSLGKLTLQAIATAIDALAVGFTLRADAPAVGVWGGTAIIGVITLGLAIGAVCIGKFVGGKLADKTGILGGGVLIGIGLKILIAALV